MPPHFGGVVPPLEPDYGCAEAWAAWPGRPSLALLQPGGGRADDSLHRVDVFYVHPTSYLARNQWNADVADPITNRWTDLSALARQASVFNSCCRIVAPRYRQASLAAVFDPENGACAYDLAYGDVLRAFEHYLAHANAGRPFILAGHSQGGLLVKRLLAQRVRGTPLARRMVAAYVVGVAVLEGAFANELEGLGPCCGPDDTGCLLSWNSFAAGSDTSGYRTRAQAAFVRDHPDGDARIVCHDPIALGERGTSLGALPGTAGEGELPALVPQSVRSRRREGVLMVEADPGLGLEPLAGGSLHYHDFAAFYGDIRADAERRVAAFLTRAA